MLTVAGLQVPVIPFEEVAGNAGTGSPSQMASVVPKLKAGVIFGSTVTLRTVFVAHCPADGVNVYVPEVWSFTEAGLQVPVMPLVDVVGKVGTLVPAQMVNAAPKSNVGVMFGVTVTVNVVGTAHCDDEGVKLYVPDAWLSTVAGLQVPEILFVDVPGNKGTEAPAQIVLDVPKLKVGVTFGFTVIVILTGRPH